MSKDIIPIQRIAQAILVLRNQRVILDYDLAVLYSVETRALKQAVRRNPDRFPRDFMFELSEQEIDGAQNTPRRKGESSLASCLPGVW